MTAAVVALALALAAAVGGFIALAVKALDAERRCGDARSDKSALAVRLETRTAERDDLANRLDDERTRANALDDLLANSAIAGPVDGAYERLLSSWATERAAHRDGTRALPTAPAAASPGPDDLLRPGQD